MVSFSKLELTVLPLKDSVFTPEGSVEGNVFNDFGVFVLILLPNYPQCRLASFSVSRREESSTSYENTASLPLPQQWS